MAIIEDVEVQIVFTNTGQALSEYDNPEPATTSKAKSVEKYIQAETGMEFHILVKLKKGFNYHGADGVRVSYNIDGGVLSRIKFFEPPNGTKNGHLLAQQVYTIDKVTIRTGDVWKRIRYSFNSVDVDEDLITTKATLEKQFEMLGSIQINVDRVKQHKREADGCFDCGVEEWTEKVDKKLLLKSISHTVKASRAIVVSEPKATQYKGTPIAGQHGKKLRFKFRYRSHLSLQTLGCIQRTPSPAPTAERAPEDLIEEERTAELVRIRAKLQDLHSKNRTLMQANQEMNKQIRERMAAFVGGSSSKHTKPVKRERVKAEEHDSEVGSLGSPTSRNTKRAKTCDLTGDD